MDESDTILRYTWEQLYEMRNTLHKTAPKLPSRINKNVPLSSKSTSRSLNVRAKNSKAGGNKKANRGATSNVPSVVDYKLRPRCEESSTDTPEWADINMTISDNFDFTTSILDRDIPKSSMVSGDENEVLGDEEARSRFPFTSTSIPSEHESRFGFQLESEVNAEEPVGVQVDLKNLFSGINSSQLRPMPLITQKVQPIIPTPVPHNSVSMLQKKKGKHVRPSYVGTYSNLGAVSANASTPTEPQSVDLKALFSSTSFRSAGTSNVPPMPTSLSNEDIEKHVQSSQ